MATSKNDVTGDFIKTKAGDQNAYADGWDRIFGKKKQQDALDELARINQELGLYDTGSNGDMDRAHVLRDHMGRPLDI